MTPDPIGLMGGMNLYTYVQNNPVNYVDPWGLCIGPCEALGKLGLYDGIIRITIGQQIWDNWFANEGIDDDTDMTDPSTWPKPPVDGECKEGEPSKQKPRDRGEKSLWDSEGGEWRPHKPDKQRHGVRS